MIEIRAGRGRRREVDRERIEHDIFSERFLIKRPLLQALEPDRRRPPVLLIDELDRTDEPFEAYLLEVLSDWQVTIPEIGTVKAEQPPVVIITSNRTREIHDAVKRRCFYHWVDYPDARARARDPAAQGAGRPQGLSARGGGLRAGAAQGGSVQAARRGRDHRLGELPGRARRVALDPETVNNTLGVLLKYQDDIARIAGGKAKALLDEAKAALRAAERHCSLASGCATRSSP